MTRKEDWQTLLHDYLSSHSQTRFQYGVMDCCLFVADAVLAITDTDLAAAFRGRYASRKAAFAAVKSYCGRPTVEAIAECVCAEHGVPEVPVPFARRGDMILIGEASRSTLGIVALHGQEVITVSKEGLWRLPLSLAKRAWRI